MNRKFRGKFQHHGGKNHFHNTRKDFSFKKKFHSHCNSAITTGSNDAENCSKTETVNGLKETDVGITEYISKHEGFSGVIKQRYADFHVNEIDCDGNVVTLTNVKAPEVEVKQGIEEGLKSIVSPDIHEKIKGLVSENEGSNNEVEIEVTEMSKDDRRNLHTAIKAFGTGKLISNTKQKEEKKFIIICRHNNKGKSDRQDLRREWPAAYGGDYVHFVLFKENMDTMETVNLIASKLRMKPNMITYAGTKDRRGVTSQMMSIRRVEPKTLVNLSSGIRGISLGNYTFKMKGLELGNLHGNRFRIVLRNVTGSDEQIQQAMSSLTENGFLNYYGMQRFGSSVSVPTHAVGKALLQGNWKLAVELILKPREAEQNQSLAKARKIWWTTRDAAAALQGLLNKEKLIEGKLLLGLSQCSANDYINALEKIPRNTRLLYLHSYQSLIWNKVVSQRVQEFELKPLPGDLVFMNDVQADLPDEFGSEENDDSESTDKSEKRPKVRVISESDLDTVKIHDIVMPLPGHDVTYPKNVMKDWYEDLLKLDGLSSDTLKQNVRKYSVSGAYRKMVIRPDNLSWKKMRYTDPTKALELSDVEKMKKVESPKDEPEGAYKALTLDFCLPSSTYATMALREILKSDTSCQHQASLNDYHVQKAGDTSSGGSKETVSSSSSLDVSEDVSKVTVADEAKNNVESEGNREIKQESIEVENEDDAENHKRKGSDANDMVEVADEAKNNVETEQENKIKQECSGVENEDDEAKNRKRKGNDANDVVEVAEAKNNVETEQKKVKQECSGVENEDEAENHKRKGSDANDMVEEKKIKSETVL